MLVGSIAVAAAAVTVGVMLRDDEPKYVSGDGGRLVFTLERAR